MGGTGHHLGAGITVFIQLRDALDNSFREFTYVSFIWHLIFFPPYLTSNNQRNKAKTHKPRLSDTSNNGFLFQSGFHWSYLQWWQPRCRNKTLPKKYDGLIYFQMDGFPNLASKLKKSAGSPLKWWKQNESTRCCGYLGNARLSAAPCQIMTPPTESPATNTTGAEYARSLLAK